MFFIGDLPHLKTLESPEVLLHGLWKALYSNSRCALCDATAQQSLEPKTATFGQSSSYFGSTNVARCYLTIAFLDKFMVYFHLLTFLAACMCIIIYIYVYHSLSLSLSLASACSTIALLFVSRLFARKTRRKFVQISSQKYREFRASNHFF